MNGHGRTASVPGFRVQGLGFVPRASGSALPRSSMNESLFLQSQEPAETMKAVRRRVLGFRV